MSFPRRRALGLLATVVAGTLSVPGWAQGPLTVSAGPSATTPHASSSSFAAKARWLAGIGADERVETDFEGQLDGLDAAALYIDEGGASCESGVEVLVVARPGAAPAIGRIDDTGCFSRPIVGKERSLQFRGPEDALVIRTSVSPTSGGQLWRFTPGDGLKLVGNLTFAPQPGTAMSLASTSSVRYAFQFYDNAEFLERFQSLVGSDATSIMRANQTAAPVNQSSDGRFVVAPGCMPHNCTDEAGLLVVDRQTSSVYVAYKPDGRPIKVYPAVGAWPSSARQALKTWAAPWS
jgi:hypothetical protein